MNLKLCGIAVFTLVVFLVSGCATSIYLQVTRPAEVNMSGAKKIAILDFGFPPDSGKVLTYDELWALYLAKSLGIEQPREIPLREMIAQYATDRMISTLANTGYFQIINPQTVSAAIRNSGTRHPDPIQIGQMVDAQAIIVGDITQFIAKEEIERETVTTTDPETGTESTYQVDYINRSLSIQLTYRVVNTSTGTIMATRTFDDASHDRVPWEKKEGMPSIEYIFRQMIDKIMPKSWAASL
jgi:curli biogenesis system outer membrane secretion channel CsgG